MIYLEGQKSYYSMIYHTTYKFRLYPTKEQIELLTQWQGAQRALWNCANEQRIFRMKNPSGAGNRWPNFFDQCKELTELRKEIDWLKAVPAVFQQPLLKKLHDTWQGFFKKTNGLPKFKSKYRNQPALSTKALQGIVFSRNRIRFPKIGWINLRNHQKVEGKVVTASISNDINHWFVSITCELEVEDPKHPNNSIIGLDLGVTNVISDSDGRVVTNPRHFNSLAKKLASVQKKLARKKKGSNRWAKARRRVAKVYRTIRRRREDFLHNLSSHYSKNHGVIVLEDLRVSNMSRSASGTLESPGTNVSQKRGLTRSILDVGWYKFREQLTYKLERLGGRLIVVDPRYTSQTCSSCNHVSKESRKGLRFECVSCGYKDNADVNAAKNLRVRGLAALMPLDSNTDAASVSVRGGLVCSRTPMSRKLTPNVETLEN